MFENPTTQACCALLKRIKNLNEAAARRALAGGMTVVMDRSIYRDYRDYCR